MIGLCIPRCQVSGLCARGQRNVQCAPTARNFCLDRLSVEIDETAAPDHLAMELQRPFRVVSCLSDGPRETPAPISGPALRERTSRPVIRRS